VVISLDVVSTHVFCVCVRLCFQQEMHAKAIDAVRRKDIQIMPERFEKVSEATVYCMLYCHSHVQYILSLR
jgi:hypothetical protein